MPIPSSVPAYLRAAYPLTLPRWNTRREGTVGPAEFDHFWRTMDLWGNQMFDAVSALNTKVEALDVASGEHMQLIEKVQPANGSDRFVFTSIPTGFENYHIRYRGTSNTGADVNRVFAMRFNGDGGGNTSYIWSQVDNGTITKSAGTADHLRMGVVNGGQNASDFWGTIDINQLGGNRSYVTMQGGYESGGSFGTINPVTAEAFWTSGGNLIDQILMVVFGGGATGINGGAAWLYGVK